MPVLQSQPPPRRSTRRSTRAATRDQGEHNSEPDQANRGLATSAAASLSAATGSVCSPARVDALKAAAEKRQKLATRCRRQAQELRDKATKARCRLSMIRAARHNCIARYLVLHSQILLWPTTEFKANHKSSYVNQVISLVSMAQLRDCVARLSLRCLGHFTVGSSEQWSSQVCGYEWHRLLTTASLPKRPSRHAHALETVLLFTGAAAGSLASPRTRSGSALGRVAAAASSTAMLQLRLPSSGGRS